MENCIFCKITNREIPAYIVYEDDNFLALLDIHPQSPGHTQVISKKHYRWVWDLPARPAETSAKQIGQQTSPNLGDYFEVVGKIARAQQKAFGNEWILSKIVGDEVQHAHIWVFPSNETAGDKMDFEGNKKKIIENLEK